MLKQNPKPKWVDFLQTQEKKEELDPFGMTRTFFELISSLVLGSGRSVQGLWLHGSRS